MGDIIRMPLTQGKSAIIDAADEELVGQHKWFAVHRDKLWHAARNIRLPTGNRLQYMHTFLTGYAQTDHINHDGLDNRRANLREATHTQNMQNRRPWGKTGYKGVLRTNAGRYRARIGSGSRQASLGTFDTPEEAAMAYDRAARELHGEFAYLNFPELRTG